MALRNLAGAVFAHAGRHPHRVAVRGDGPPLTIGALGDRVAAYAARVIDAGVAPGDRVTLIGPSVPERRWITSQRRSRYRPPPARTQTAAGAV